MAFLNFSNVRIAGVSACVPRNVVDNFCGEGISKDYNPEDFVKTTGIRERRVGDLTTSDLCIPAAEKLISDLGWNKEDIEAVIFVSQFRDYILPATACIIQDKLGLSRECYATDISLGCSGWVYGLSSTVSLMCNGGIKKALLMAGDARRHYNAVEPLFGYAGTVTALEYQEGEKGFSFHFGTDGSGYDAIIIEDGGARNQINESSFQHQSIGDGRLEIKMNGMDVFSFGISAAPKSVKKLVEHFDLDYADIDYFVFHQANMMMNKMITKKLKLQETKCPTNLFHFGNTSSASIPLVIVTELKNKCEKDRTKFICCGFGVGLSWGSVAFETKDIIISDLVEI